MKGTGLAIIILALMAGRAGATDFWGHFAENLAYHSSVDTGTLPTQMTSSRLSGREIAKLMGRSFAQALPIRIGEVAGDLRLVTLPCMFTPEPEKCYVKIVLGRTFNEIGFLKAPGFSQRYLERFRDKFTRVRMKETPEEKRYRAAMVSRRNVFNPRFGFDFEKMDAVFAAPFYTYFGIYVEPKFTLRHQATMSMLYKRFSLEFNRNGAELGYQFAKKPFGKHYYTITWKPGDSEINVQNVFATW